GSSTAGAGAFEGPAGAPGSGAGSSAGGVSSPGISISPPSSTGAGSGFAARAGVSLAIRNPVQKLRSSADSAARRAVSSNPDLVAKEAPRLRGTFLSG